MTYSPSARILSSALPPAARLRGVCPCEVMSWPDAMLSAGHDYSIDFSDQLEPGDRIVTVLATTDGGTVAWNSIFGTKATAWVQWSQMGQQSISFDVGTANSNTLSATAYVAVNCRSVSMLPAVPEYAPNAFVTGNVIMPDANGNPLIFG